MSFAVTTKAFSPGGAIPKSYGRLREKCPRNRYGMGQIMAYFGPGKGRVVHDRLFGLGTNAKRLRAEANEDIFIRSRKAKRKFRFI